VREAVRAWIEEFVIGLSLCPFAAEPLHEGRVRFAVSAATTPAALFDDLMAELSLLDAVPASEVETTLLIHPHALLDFADFNRFLDAADVAVEASGLTGVVQIASFHPAYVFGDAPADDIANATNRSPYPMLHLLREASIARAVREHGDTKAIPARNAALLRRLGPKGVRARGGSDF